MKTLFYNLKSKNKNLKQAYMLIFNADGNSSQKIIILHHEYTYGNWKKSSDHL